MNSTAVRVWLSLMLVLLGAYGAYSFWRVSERTAQVGEPAPDGEPLITTDADLADFTFTERSGKEVNLGQFEGQVWIASFFFASCPGPCRQMNISLAGLQKELAESDVKIVSITVDPDNDTPEVLRQYAASFEADGERWLFLTGKFSDVVQLGQNVFHVTVGPKLHTERILVIGRDGNVHGTYNATSTEQMRLARKKIDELLAAPAPQGEEEVASSAAAVPSTSEAESR